MKSFTEYLAESRSAPLYHGTTEEALWGILETNVLQATPGDEFYTTRGNALSLSRSFNYAKSWAQTTYGYNGERIVVLELDQQKLTHRYKIRPYNYQYNAGDSHSARQSDPHHGKMAEFGANEYEEYVDRDVPNAKSYITKVHLIGSWPRGTVKKLRELMPHSEIKG